MELARLVSGRHGEGNNGLGILQDIRVVADFPVESPHITPHERVPAGTQTTNTEEYCYCLNEGRVIVDVGIMETGHGVQLSNELGRYQEFVLVGKLSEILFTLTSGS